MKVGQDTFAPTEAAPESLALMKVGQDTFAYTEAARDTFTPSGAAQGTQKGQGSFHNEGRLTESSLRCSFQTHFAIHGILDHDSKWLEGRDDTVSAIVAFTYATGAHR